MESDKKTDIVSVSVIIPVYNRQTFVEDCINSVLNQSLDSVEIIIVDDGSCIELKNQLESLKNKNNNIILVNQDHKGAWAARNSGIKNAHGKYVCFMDSDDYYFDETALEKLYKAANNNQALVCGGNIVNVSEGEKQEFRGYVFEKEGFHEYDIYPQLYGHTRYIYSREFLINNEIEYYPLKRFEDPPFVVEALIQAKKYYAITDVVYCCRQYKRKRIYDYDTICDIARGIYYSYSLCKKFDLKYETVLNLGVEGAINSIIAEVLYYHAIDNNKLNDILFKINDIHSQIFKKNLSILQNEEDSQLWVKDSLEALVKIDNANKIIMYGAGFVARKLLDSGLVSKVKIERIAVSQKNNITNMLGLQIINIEECRNSSNLIIIAVNRDKSDDMIKRLKELNCDNYCIVDDKCIRLGQYLNEYRLNKTLSEG